MWGSGGWLGGWLDRAGGCWESWDGDGQELKSISRGRRCDRGASARPERTFCLRFFLSASVPLPPGGFFFGLPGLETERGDVRARIVHSLSRFLCGRKREISSRQRTEPGQGLISRRLGWTWLDGPKPALQLRIRCAPTKRGAAGRLLRKTVISLCSHNCASFSAAHSADRDAKPSPGWNPLSCRPKLDGSVRRFSTLHNLCFSLSS